MKWISIVFPLVLVSGACKDKPTIPTALLYATLNAIIQQDSVFADMVCHSFAAPNLPADIQSAYFKTDSLFIQKQLVLARTAQIVPGQLQFYYPRKQRLEKTRLDTTCSAGILYHLSYPLFSSDLHTVLIGITEDCNCLSSDVSK
ncbi:hypothetical protein ACX0G9_26485 [Flavitalea flava]